MKNIGISLLLCSLCLGAYAQVQPTSAPASSNPAGNITTTNVNNSHALDSNTFERTQRSVFDFDTDSLNLETGALNWKGKTFEIGNSRVVRARFERYLATDFSKMNIDNYQAIINEIAGILAANSQTPVNESILIAWNKLYDAAEYEIDNDGSLTIANTVYTTLRMRDDYARFKTDLDLIAGRKKELTDALVDQHDKTRRKTEMDIARARMNEGTVDKKIRLNKDPKSENANNKDEKSDMLSGARTDDLLKIADLTAERAKKEAEAVAKGAQMELTGTKAMMQFQSQIVSFMLARRFQHAVIGSYFYRHLYKGHVQNFEVGRDEFKKFFPVSNFLPNNDIIENLATEARNDVREGMMAVNTLYDSGQRYNALTRLMETFLLGENEAPVRSFPFEHKKVLLTLFQDMSAMKDMSDNRDFDGILEILERVKAEASDFPYREVMSKIRTAQQASNLKIMEARAAAFNNKTEDARQAITEAATIWPLNPELDKFTKEVMEATVGVSKYAKRFDELVEKSSFREIVGDAPEYAIALRESPEKQKQLKEIVLNISQIDFMIAQAKELHAQGNSYIAWEMLEKALIIDPADPVLARAMVNLAPNVADYSLVLRKAKEAEAEGKYSVALTNYLQAQDIFPTSQECRLGVERNGKKVLDSMPRGR